jgi:hypothetical protein
MSQISPRSHACNTFNDIAPFQSLGFAARKALAVFELRAWARAELYAAYVYDLHEAVDLLQADAETSGLVAELGQDEVQRILADAFHSSCFALSLGPEIVREDHMDTFEVACHRADAKHKRNPRTEQLCAIINDDISYERARFLLRQGRPTPKPTLDAIKVALREHGLSALEAPSTKQRLKTCDDAAMADLDRFIQKEFPSA